MPGKYASEVALFHYGFLGSQKTRLPHGAFRDWDCNALPGEVFFGYQLSQKDRDTKCKIDRQTCSIMPRIGLTFHIPSCACTTCFVPGLDPDCNT